jgi:hypothetical protein
VQIFEIFPGKKDICVQIMQRRMFLRKLYCYIEDNYIQSQSVKKFSQLCCDCFNPCPPGSLVSPQQFKHYSGSDGQGMQECNRPPELFLLSLMSSSQGWPAGPPTI